MSKQTAIEQLSIAFRQWEKDWNNYNKTNKNKPQSYDEFIKPFLEMEKEQNNNKLPTIDSLPPSELIALIKYYDEKLEGVNRYRSNEQIEAEIIIKNIEKRLTDICKIFC